MTHQTMVAAVPTALPAPRSPLPQVWDLDTQHCCQTVGGYKAEVWSLDVHPEAGLLVTGATDDEIRMFRIRCVRGQVGWWRGGREGSHPWDGTGQSTYNQLHFPCLLFFIGKL